MNCLLITHSDLDGISPIILLNLTGIKFEYHSIEISEVEKTFEKLFKTDLTTYDMIYITDLTIPEAIYEEIIRRKLNIEVFDHHETHLYANKYPFVNISINFNDHQTCATELFYYYLLNEYSALNNQSIHDYVQFVRELDTYHFTSNTPRQIEALRKVLGKLEFIKTITKRLKKNKDAFTFTAFENRYFKISALECERYLQAKEQDMLRYSINEYTCGIVFAENHKSELGNYLSSKYPELDLIIIYDPSKGISYRTTHDDISVSQFAENFGGGGHQKASGSPFTITNRQAIIELYFKDAKCLDEKI